MRSLIAAAALLLAVPTFAADQPPTLTIGSSLPSFSLPGVDGKTYTDQSFKDARILAIIFTCPHCPTAQAYQERIKKLVTDYSAKGVKIVAINAKEDGRDDPRAYIRGLGFAPIAVANGDAIAAAYGVQYIPGLLVVDGTGHIAYRRPWTDLPAGQTVAELWDQQVRTALNALIRG